MIKPLTSLRLIFALLVFAAHCYTIDSHFAHFLYKEGYVGVEFFFVLSGFVIAYNYQEKFEQKSITKRDFWIARFARVYPLHWATLFPSLLTGGALLAMNWDKVVVFFCQLFLIHPFVPVDSYFFSYNSPSWSLGCEQLFYVLFPFLALWLNDTKRLFWTIFIAGMVCAIGMFFTPVDLIRGYWYVNPLTRFPDFLVGMLLFKLYAQSKKDWSFGRATWLEIGAVLLFIAFYYCGAAGSLPKVYRYTIYYWLPISLVIYVFAINKGLLSRLLSNKYLVIGGEISYGIYLLHLFVMQLYTESNWNYSPWIVIPAVLLITIGLSLLSFYYFEKPVNRYIRNKYIYQK